MLIGALLLLTWFILLIRYPGKALPISMAALLGLGLVASWVLWQESRESRHLAHLQLRLAYDPQRCPANRPLALELTNGSDAALQELRWQVAAYRPGESVNLARQLYESPRYSGPGELLPGASWQDCLPLPTLRSGYRASTLEFRAERLQGSFAD
ncbi:multidrug transporter [Pseudomonas lalucatii]|uniref:Multidrug transporter n=1 Tax=Pseudomonas lalucatii TaxID=1424203 RepID=A0ABS5Q5X6_9PSED|nr:multidrug transporter [Pseudomonas lalucatii]MBS7663723.1 multidrug transporter [Pseudomonas lalucatii]MBS7689705.1 multidrug transporter [Pseudomonas lalucatii]QVM86857.1 multidrug transporter [Pseudomonas lalucatii]